MNKHTPGPWKREEIDQHLGYDCMTAGIRVGPVVLDGSDYGQNRCEAMSTDARARMEADGALIAPAPDLLAALEELLPCCAPAVCASRVWNAMEAARAVIARAWGE